MKKLHILIPSLVATVGMPLISVVGCRNGQDGPTPPEPEPEVHNVVVDPSSDTTDITISVPEITLNKQLVVSYEITNPEKQLDADFSWIKFASNQLPLSNPEFSYDDNKITIPADKVTTYDITICLKTKLIPPPPPVASDFSTDPWTTIGYYANQGLAKLHEVYQDDCENNPDERFKGTLIGLTRKIWINNSEHIVKVVGENQDFLPISADNPSPDPEKPVALTFQFNNLISDENGQVIKKNWNPIEDNGNYWNSMLHHFLNDASDGNVYEMIASDSRNQGLIDEGIMKQVSRTVCISKSGGWQALPNKTNLFCLSLASIFDQSLVKEKNPLYAPEGIQYTYYLKNIGMGVIEEQTYDSLILTDVSGTALDYWTCSPHLGNYFFVWKIDETGMTDRDAFTNSSHGMAPCFCI